MEKSNGSVKVTRILDNNNGRKLKNLKRKLKNLKRKLKKKIIVYYI